MGTDIFLSVAIVAVVSGFGGIATVAADIACIIFFVAVALILVFLMINLLQGRRSPSPMG